MGDDWFRNQTWSAEISARFDEKLRRARDKARYLKLQAGTLASTHPVVALELLDRFFEFPENIFVAEAHGVRATAFLTLEHWDEAADAYESALAREAEFPNVKTQAFVKFPFLIATTPLPTRYERALEVLEARQFDLTFPVEHFKWNAAMSMILAARGDRVAASGHARLALVAERRQHSGLRYHPNVGLVDEEFASVTSKLRALADA